MLFIISFIMWIAFAAGVGSYAREKGLSGPGYFFLSLVVSPVVGFIIVATSAPNRAKIAARPDSGLKCCPQCAELVQREARICRYCGSKFMHPDVAKIVFGE